MLRSIQQNIKQKHQTAVAIKSIRSFLLPLDTILKWLVSSVLFSGFQRFTCWSAFFRVSSCASGLLELHTELQPSLREISYQQEPTRPWWQAQQEAEQASTDRAVIGGKCRSKTRQESLAFGSNYWGNLLPTAWESKHLFTCKSSVKHTWTSLFSASKWPTSFDWIARKMHSIAISTVLQSKWRNMKIVVGLEEQTDACNGYGSDLSISSLEYRLIQVWRLCLDFSEKRVLTFWHGPTSVQDFKEPRYYELYNMVRAYTGAIPGERQKQGRTAGPLIWG